MHFDWFSDTLERNIN